MHKRPQRLLYDPKTFLTMGRPCPEPPTNCHVFPADLYFNLLIIMIDLEKFSCSKNMKFHVIGTLHVFVLSS